MANENDISGKVGLDITDFKANISSLSQQIKVIDTGFKASAAGMKDWGNNADGLKARIKSLTDIIELQRQKVENLKGIYAKVAAEKGESSKAARDLEIRINKETAALNKNQLELNSTTQQLDDFGKEADDAEKETEQLADAQDKAAKSSHGLGAALKTAAGVMGTVAVAAGAAAVKLGKEVVAQFGELEQNLGGSEAVFGEYAASIQKTGEEAYKNLGVSQSDYLATANKMGALFQGSGISQQKSLELTEQAMQRAADMASVMGIEHVFCYGGRHGCREGQLHHDGQSWREDGRY